MSPASPTRLLFSFPKWGEQRAVGLHCAHPDVKQGSLAASHNAARFLATICGRRLRTHQERESGNRQIRPSLTSLVFFSPSPDTETRAGALLEVQQPAL